MTENIKYNGDKLQEILMRRIRQTEKDNWMTLVKKIRNRFGDEKLFFTFVPFKEHRMIQESTFAHDNIEHIDDWCISTNSRLFLGYIYAVIMVVRIFLPEKVTTHNGNMEIPRKDLYHFSVKKDEIVLFDEEETYDSQNTDAFTGDQLDHEKGIVYRSSEELYDDLQMEYITAPHDI